MKEIYKPRTYINNLKDGICTKDRQKIVAKYVAELEEKIQKQKRI